MILSDAADAQVPSSDRRSVLLGQRKKSTASKDKPVTFSRGQQAATPPPENASTAKVSEPRKSSGRKAAPKKANAGEALLEELRHQMQLLREELSQRPRWEDLHQLERRFFELLENHSSQSDAKDRLRLREEELEEMASVAQEFQDQLAAAQTRLLQLEQSSQEDRLARKQLTELLDSSRIQLVQMETDNQILHNRLERAQGFLRDALLGLLSPGDEFNEELVEQIQHFLTEES